MIYRALEKNQTLKSTKQISAVFGVGLILLGVFKRYPYGLLAGAVFLIVSIFKKEVYVDETGLVTSFHILMFAHEDVWRFDEMQYIHREPDLRRPDAAVLHFTRGVMSKPILFRNEDCRAIVEMAKAANPDIEYTERTR